jgi:hypothetical protein
MEFEHERYEHLASFRFEQQQTIRGNVRRKMLISKTSQSRIFKSSFSKALFYFFI